MYKSFEVSNYRCFSKLTLAQLERVNLIAGMNNVGKTALLEALFLHCGAYNPELALRVNAFRGIEKVKIDLGRWGETPWDSLFYQFDVTKSIELKGEDTQAGHRSLRLRVLREPTELVRVAQFINGSYDNPERAFRPDESRKVTDTSETVKVTDTVTRTSEGVKVLELEYQDKERHGNCYMILDEKGIRTMPVLPSPPFPAFFEGARMRIPRQDEAERFGQLEIRKKQETVQRVLQLIEPRLKRLAIAVVAGEPILHGDIGADRLMPLPLMGEGMVRLASLVIHIGNAPNGVVLVDEIENGLHHSVLPQVWRAIGEAAREFDTQIFATTHSLECIVAAHKAFSMSGRYDFRLHRLERVNETIRAVTYDQETLEGAIEAGLEVR